MTLVLTGPTPRDRAKTTFTTVTMLRLLRSPYVFLLLPVLFWAGNAVIGRAVVGEVPPFTLSFWRWVTASLILLPIGLPRLLAQRERLRGRWPVLLALAMSSVAAYNTLLYLALQTTTAINATLVGCSMPIVIITLSWLWLGESIHLRQGFGVVLSLLGVVLVIARGDPAALLALHFQTGDGWMMVGVLSWSIYSVLLRRYPTSIEPFALLTLLVLLGTPMILPFYLWELAQGQIWHPSSHSLAVIAYVAIFPSILAYYFWNIGVAKLGANMAGLYANLLPIFTAILAVLLLGESFRWFHAVGLILISLGIWLATARQPRPLQ